MSKQIHQLILKKEKKDHFPNKKDILDTTLQQFVSLKAKIQYSLILKKDFQDYKKKTNQF